MSAEQSGQILAECTTEGLLTITLSQPEKRNALSLHMRRELRTAITGLASDVRAVVITGAEGYFCSGGDLTESTTDADEVRRFDDLLAIVDAILLAPVPVIAAVEGGAHGVGLSIAVACDHIVASEESSFGAPFTKVGLVGDGGITWTLPRRIGPSRARSMLIGAERASAGEALGMGLVDRLAPAGQALETASDVAAAWAVNSPEAIRAMKQLLAASPASHVEALKLEERAQRRMMAGPDAREARAAFAERRPPNFR
ncbi:enoyl-CoA hydratase/isomerase family protein [Ilumatobacter nonamiensis]|uniref:enoyl-CoA hydratase/isomerase family protein n=1 Tax=Ilumatobacter nonamiensis TaxID=467093 RepID=UPI00058C90B7|nr:enoyl-CoA hydratase/isomerase family protein [Ilumatobacter nonamiensis]